jgi:hypothetical protein
MADVDQSAAEVNIDQTAPEVDTEDFHSYTGEDGNTQSWKNADDLNQWIKQSGMFQADYTRKSQAREAEYRQKMADLDRERSEFTRQRDEWEQGDKAKYDRWNEAFSKRPQIAQQIGKLVDQPSSPEETFLRGQEYTDSKSAEMVRRLDALEAERAEEKLERERDAIYGELEKEIPDFDRDRLSSALGKLDGNDMKALMTMVWKADNYNPQEMQEKVEQNIAKKQGVGMLPAGGGPPKQSKGSIDPKKAREEAQEWANSS